MTEPLARPEGSNADEWAVFLEEYRNAPSYIACQIASAIEDAERDACERAIERMGWPEIRAFEDELCRGQSIDEDAGGYFLRAIKRLFGIKTQSKVASYREAAAALLAARKEAE